VSFEDCVKDDTKNEFAGKAKQHQMISSQTFQTFTSNPIDFKQGETMQQLQDPQFGSNLRNL